MTDFRKITEMLILSCPQREIQRECGASPNTIVKVRKALESSGKSSSEILQMNEEDLCSMISPIRPRKPKECACMEPDLSRAAMSILRGETIKTAWRDYCKEATKAGLRPLKYAAYCKILKTSGTSALASEDSRFKAGLLVFVETKYTVQIKKESRNICFAIFPLSRMTFFDMHSSADKGVQVTVLQDIFRNAGGVPPYIHIYKDTGKNEGMSDMVTYYGSQIIGWVPEGVSKIVEDADTYVSRRISNHRFSSKEEAIDYFDQIQNEYNDRQFGYLCRSRDELFEELDCKELKPLPQHGYELFEEKLAKIQFDYHVTYKKVRYSVPPEAYLDSTDVILSISTSRIEIISKTGELLAVHPHFPDNKFWYSTLPEHRRTSAQLEELPWNSGRFLNWARRRFGEDTASLIRGIIDGYEIEQQAYSQCYWLLTFGEKMDRQGRTDEFISACRELRDGPLAHAYYAVKKRLGEG